MCLSPLPALWPLLGQCEDPSGSSHQGYPGEFKQLQRICLLRTVTSSIPRLTRISIYQDSRVNLHSLGLCTPVPRRKKIDLKALSGSVPLPYAAVPTLPVPHPRPVLDTGAGRCPKVVSLAPVSLWIGHWPPLLKWVQKPLTPKPNHTHVSQGNG